MAKSLGSLVIDLALNTARIDKGITSTNKKLDYFGNNVRSIARYASAAFAGISIAALTKEVVDVVDKYTALEGRLKLVAKEGENLVSTQRRLFDISQESRNETGATVDLYTRLARSTKDLGISQESLFRTTETINKAITISGATSQEASAALFQLGQGLSAGALRGEELNSVLEQTPRVAQAIADGLGLSISELRKYGAEGKLSAEAVIEALEKQGNTINKEFANIPQTVGQAYTALKNDIESIVKTFGGLSNAVRDSINGIRDLAGTIRNFLNSEERAAEQTRLYNEYIKGNVQLLKEQGIIEQGVSDVRKSSVEDLKRYIKAAENLGIALKRNAQLTTIVEQIQNYQGQLGSLTTRLTALQKVNVDTGKAQEILSNQISNTQNKIDGLINNYIKLYNAQDEGNNKQKESAVEHAKYVAGLSKQEELMRANFTIQEKANNSLLVAESLYQGNIISLDAYRQKIQEANDSLAAFNRTQLENQPQKGFGISEGSRAEFYDSELEAERNFIDQSLEQNREWKQKISDYNKELAEERKQQNYSLLSSTASVFGSLATIIGSGSKKNFELSKKLARAETVLNTIKGAHSAFSDTPGPLPVKIAAGVAATAIGLGRLAAINRTTFGSSSAAAGSSGAGSFVPAPSPGPITPGQTNAAQGQTFIIISGGETITEQQLDDILSRASQRINEGSQVIIRRDSVQAAELASAVA